jgi:hypothetical protein
MTVNEVIDLTCALRPNELDRTVLTRLLLELEALLAVEVRGEGAVPPKHPHVAGRECLTVPAPFDRLYWTYLVSMIDLASGDSAAYRISEALFTEARDAYARWYQRTGGGV